MLARSPYLWFKVFFVRPAIGGKPGRPERDVNMEKLKRFAAHNGLSGELNSIAPSAGFGIMEIHCTEKLARRLSDLPDIESIQEK